MSANEAQHRAWRAESMFDTGQILFELKGIELLLLVWTAIVEMLLKHVVVTIILQ